MMRSPVTIHEIDARSRADRNRFINMPFDLYRDSPYWVPQVRGDALMQLNRDKNPFYWQNDAAFFLAERDGRDVGRIVALQPNTYNDFKGTSEAFFYLFETVNDCAVSDALLDAAAGWARGRGLTTLRGPLGFMAMDGIGMLAEGFDHYPAVGVPYNYSYYPGLVEAWGFELEERIYSGYLDIHRLYHGFPEKVRRVAEKVRQRYGFTIRTYSTKAALKKEALGKVVDVYNEALTHIAGDPPLPHEQAMTVFESAILIANPKMIKFIEKDGEMVGFLFCFLNISEGLRKAKGRTGPIGLLRILWSLRTTDALDLNGIGLLPQYQKMGGTAILYAELFDTLRSYHPRFKHADVVQISENNPASLNEMKQFGVEFYKTHHIYRKDIG